MERMPKPGEIYQHFKGNLYRIITLAEHTETAEQMVIYQALYGDLKVYARPLSLFVSEVDRRKYPDVQEKYRFTLLPLAGMPLQTTELEAGTETAGGQSSSAGRTEMPDKLYRETAEPKPETAERREEDRAQSSDGTGAAAGTEQEEEFQLDPRLLSFLEADSYERKLEIVDSLAGKVDGDMLNTMAVSLDLELSGRDLEEQYLELKNCLLMLEKYECNRLR